MIAQKNDAEYEIHNLRKEIAHLREMVRNRDALITELNLQLVAAASHGRD